MQFSELTAEKQELLGHLFDPKNDMALTNLLPNGYSTRLLKCVAESEDEILELLGDEEHLLKYLRSHKSYSPTVNDHRVRYLFWHEAENAIVENRKMVLSNTHNLVCDAKVFQNLFLKLPYRAAFLCCRPAAYQHTLKEMLLHGMQRLRQVLDMPEHDPVTGKFNPKIVELKLKITAMVDMRLHGAPTQKIHQVTQNLPGSLGAGQKGEVRELIQKGDMRTIQQRIKEIEAERRKLEGRITAEPVEVEVEKI